MNENPWRPITAVSSVVIVACTLYFLIYVALIAPRFAAMFADFGGELPLATRIALKPATAWISVFFLAAGTVGGVLRSRERALIWSLTAGSGMLLCLATLGVLYLPLIMLAGQIK